MVRRIGPSAERRPPGVITRIPGGHGESTCIMTDLCHNTGHLFARSLPLGDLRETTPVNVSL